MYNINRLFGLFCGYGFAVIVGHIIIKYFINDLWKKIGWNESAYEERPASYLAGLVGILERTLFVASLQYGKPEFIGVWLVLKVASTWNRWGETGTIGGKKIEGRVFFNIFLIGSGLSVAYAVGGAKMIDYATSSKWLQFIVLPLIIIAFTIVLKKAADCWDKMYKQTIPENK
jgi:hypothetical protein